MSFKAKYLGAAEGAVRAFGTIFVDGKPVEVEARFRTKVEGNPFFEATGGAHVPNPKGEPVDIPADWEGLHWSQQEKLAIEIVGGEGPLVPAEGQTRAEKARAIIASEVIGRSEWSARDDNHA